MSLVARSAPLMLVADLTQVERLQIGEIRAAGTAFRNVLARFGTLTGFADRGAAAEASRRIEEAMMLAERAVGLGREREVP